jgi:hypothetical protein
MTTKIITLLVALFCALTAACSSAKYTVKQGGLNVQGETSSSGEEATMTASRAYSNAVLAEAEADAIRIDASSRQTYAESYGKAVERGAVYPYQGGGYGNELSYYYNGIAPSAQAQPSGGAGTELAEVRGIAEGADKKATDSLKMHKRLRNELEGNAPSP